ncbi:unnamed protein product [Brachionus calyciflorus]|uniref:HTH CENPB-type domain-containing protein n=1 Tax=Brachionus calyciflorus TaxID=104777 RepID=A0A814CXQ8_9BILA|nr:unnamed protein product [Brachionus calyciflorus]
MNSLEAAVFNVEPESVLSEVDHNKPVQHRVRHTLSFKGKVINFYQKGNSINKCALEFKIDRRIISRWIKKESRIINTKLKRQRFAVTSERNMAMYPVMENQLSNWIYEKRNQGCCITANSIRSKAIELFTTIYKNTDESVTDFQCSNGWFYNFLKRKNFALRRITTSGRELPKNSISIIKNFFADCQKITNEPDFRPEKLINVDEKSIYLDFPTNSTYDCKGAKRVKATTCGGEKARISAAFTASSAGEKLPIFILVPRKTDLPNYTPPENVVIVYKESATFDENTVCSYLRKILGTHKELTDLRNIHLVIDSARCHLTSKVNKEFVDLGIEPLFVPPRMTNLLQPADVCWFAVIKKMYHQRWNEWFINEPRTFTRFGNAKSPGYAKCIQWLSDIWKEFNPELISNSFAYCGILNQFNLHSALSHILKNNTIINDFIEDLDESDEIADHFSTDERIVFFERTSNVEVTNSSPYLPSTSSPTPTIPSTNSSPSLPSTSSSTPTIPSTNSSPSLPSTSSPTPTITTWSLSVNNENNLGFSVISQYQTNSQAITSAQTTSTSLINSKKKGRPRLSPEEKERRAEERRNIKRSKN